MTTRRLLVFLAAVLVFDLRLYAADPDEFTFAIIGDTQNTAEMNPVGFVSMMRSIVANQEKRHFAFVGQVGDVVNHADREPQWQAADLAFRQLDGKIPYGVAPGNHDYDDWDKRGPSMFYHASAVFQRYFPLSRFEKTPWFGGHFNGSQNTCQLFSAGNVQFIALALEMDPGDEILAWADGLLARHRDRHAIIVTHNYNRLNAGTYPDRRNFTRVSLNHRQRAGRNGNTPDGTFDKLIKRHGNIFLVCAGHNGMGLHIDKNEYGQNVYELLAGISATGVKYDEECRIYCLTFRPAKNEFDLYRYWPERDEVDDRQKVQTFPLKMTPTTSRLPRPEVMPPGGFKAQYFTGKQRVELSTQIRGAEIRCTLDGSLPTGSSPLYSAPLEVVRSTVIRARTFHKEQVASSLTELVLIEQSSGVGLTGNYFANKTLSGDPALKRIDGAVDFEWGLDGVPEAGKLGRDFSVRWQGFVEPPFDGMYQIYGWNDGVMKAQIGDTLLFDRQAKLNPPHQNRQGELIGEIELIAGRKYPLVVEYSRHGPVATAQLFWQSKQLPKEIIPANRLYPASNSGASK